MSCEGSNCGVDGSFAQRKVLITGGMGFIGSHVVRRLVSMGSEVISLGGNRDEGELVEGAQYIFGDLARNTLETVPFVPVTIFHLAGGSSVAASVEDPTGDFLKTVYSTVLLLDYLRRHWPKAQLVYVSSAAVYGESEHKRASHDLTCLPISPYGVHKRLVEALLLDHARMYGTRSVVVRPFSVYGPGLCKQLLWDAMRKADRGVFEFFGSGREERDWVYIADLVECLLRAGQLAGVEVPVFNAGACYGVSVRDVLKELGSLAGWEREPVFLDKPKEGDPLRLVADDSAEDILGPLFKTPLRAGLRAYVDWYRSREENA